jgi:hypothetical protein
MIIEICCCEDCGKEIVFTFEEIRDYLSSGRYPIEIKCDNCGKINIFQIKKIQFSSNPDYSDLEY